MELCVGSCDCSKSVTSYKIGEAHFRLMGTTGFHAAKTKNERDGAVVRALASHQCGPGSIPRSGVKCGLSLLVLYSAPRGFLRNSGFPSPQKPKFDLIVLIVNLINSVPN